MIDLFAPERAALLEVLESLTPDEWERLATACAGWSVQDIAAHLLADNVGRLSRGRDGHENPEFGIGLEDRYLGRLVRRDRPPESSLGARDATGRVSRLIREAAGADRPRGGYLLSISGSECDQRSGRLGRIPSRRRFGWISRVSTPSAGLPPAAHSRSYRQTVADRAALLSSSARHLRARIAAFAARRVSRRRPGGNARHYRQIGGRWSVRREEGSVASLYLPLETASTTVMIPEESGVACTLHSVG